MLLEYQAVDRTGKQVIDRIESADMRTATDVLRKKDLFVTQMKPASDPTPLKRKKESARVDDSQVRLPVKQLALFTRQMAMLLASGSGVVPALQAVARQFTKPHHNRMIRRIISDIEEGAPLGNALLRFPRTFDTAYAAIIAAGEASANLPEMFNRLAKMVGQRRVVRNKIIGATAYPTLLTLLSLGITSSLLFFVLPRFGGMFHTLGVELPASTSFLLALGEWTKSYWYLPLAALLLGTSAIVFTIRSDTGRQWISDWTPRIPLVGRLISALIQAESFRVLGMLIEARVGVIEAIELARGVTRNRQFQKLYRDMETEVTCGGTLSSALEASGLISPPICHAIRTGENSGQLGTAACYIADVLDEDNAELINAVTKLLEPVILIIMGLVVGAVSISLFMPLFDMTSVL